jgi:hypothetical protein
VGLLQLMEQCLYNLSQFVECVGKSYLVKSEIAGVKQRSIKFDDGVWKL